MPAGERMPTGHNAAMVSSGRLINGGCRLSYGVHRQLLVFRRLGWGFTWNAIPFIF